MGMYSPCSFFFTSHASYKIIPNISSGIMHSMDVVCGAVACCAADASCVFEGGSSVRLFFAGRPLSGAIAVSKEMASAAVVSGESSEGSCVPESCVEDEVSVSTSSSRERDCAPALGPVAKREVHKTVWHKTAQQNVKKYL